jgi:hypothetical protein
MNTTGPALPDSLLERMQFQADPLADAAMARIVGPWAPPAGDIANAAQWQPHWQRLATATRVFPEWTDNRALTGWQAKSSGMPPDISAALETYVQAARELPAWADRAKIERAERVFTEYGPLSVALLFCSSLPECYVIPDLAAVLHVTGQLEDNVDYRIRSTGAMVFPVMMRGGLTDADGGGIAQIFKVRLIHAAIRNLVLRGSPQDAVEALGPGPHAEGAGVVPPLPAMEGTGNMHQAFFAHGWNVGAEGLPCNQEELAYTLLTFSYVFLRSMRKLGVGLPRADEEAYLHTWNVAGYFLGIERELMVDTMDEAEVLFAAVQARGRADWQRMPKTPDPRPELGNALMGAMEKLMPLALIRAFPVLLTRYLCGPATSHDLGLDQQVSWICKVLFVILTGSIRAIDTLGRLVNPGFALSRLVTRVLGYRFMTRLLMDQTRPLQLPEHVRDCMNTTMQGWGHDQQAGNWVNALEDCMTAKGNWGIPGVK